MELNQALNALDMLQRKMAAYDHAMGVIYYDGATVAPSGTAQNRGESLAILSQVSYELSTCKDTEELLEALWAEKDRLDEAQTRQVFLLRKSLEELRKIPVDEFVAYQKLVNEAEDVWHRAKNDDDFAAFCPYIDKIVEANKKFAGYVKPEMDPYEYCLDKYEEGLTRETCDNFFAALREKLVPLIRKVCESENKPDMGLLSFHAPVEKQRVLSDHLMDVLGMDRAHCAIGETEHPFTTCFTKYDCRITTHYHEDALASSLYSVVHEGGHGMYDMGVKDEFAYTCIGGGVSMAVHESQSRFFENIIGRSRAFVKVIAPKLRELFPELEKASDEDLYRAFNESHPSLIRTEADELTYCNHIMVRYELEKALFDGKITAKDLPAEWNRLYKEYLGVDVPCDREGVLQDTHWSGGMFGYFPSYALGSAYGAQLLEKMKESFDVFAAVEKGDLAPVRNWLSENIWQHGSLYTPTVLMEKAFGGKFDAKYYVDYLTEKFTEIYGL
ncbi:MAG: carboxypeptidase M32 [Clostridiales bacterium]|nr:carboxypeptidase M32 [Clostridiales bacterium]